MAPRLRSLRWPVVAVAGEADVLDDEQAVGAVRGDGGHTGGRNASTIYINPLDEWKTKPYARYRDPVAMAYVHEFTLKTFPSAVSGAPPACTKNHTVPGFLFSHGGFSGNLYHDCTDVLVPLFISMRQFDGEVQFLLSGLKSWWVSKFSLLFRQLTKYDIIDVDNDREVHCFPSIVIGATFKDLAKDMEVSYMDYNVQLEESSLLDQYLRNHQVLTSPYAVHKFGWDALKSAYLDK